MLKILFVILTLFTVSFGYSQPGVLEFKVSKPDLELKVSPVDSVFYSDKRNIIYVQKLAGKSEIARVRLTTGRIRLLRPGVYEATFDTVGKTVLRVIERKPNGKTQLAFAKPYDVIETTKPTVTVCGVKQDSAVGLKRMLHIGTLEANFKNQGQITPAVVSFDMVNLIGGSEQVYHSNNNKFTIQMRNAVKNMSDGRLLEFRNINILLPDRSLYTLAKLSVFVITTDEYSVGDRNKIGGQ